MDFLEKDKLARLDEERQQRRKARAKEALQRIQEAVGKQTLQTVTENIPTGPGMLVEQAGGLSQEVAEQATTAADRRRARRAKKRAESTAGTDATGGGLLDVVTQAVTNGDLDLGAGGLDQAAVSDAVGNVANNPLADMRQTAESVVDGKEQVGSIVDKLGAGSIVDKLGTGSIVDKLGAGSIVDKLGTGSIVDKLGAGSIVDKLQVPAKHGALGHLVGQALGGTDAVKNLIPAQVDQIAQHGEELTHPTQILEQLKSIGPISEHEPSLAAITQNPDGVDPVVVDAVRGARSEIAKLKSHRTQITNLTGKWKHATSDQRGAQVKLLDDKIHQTATSVVETHGLTGKSATEQPNTPIITPKADGAKQVQTEHGDDVANTPDPNALGAKRPYYPPLPKAQRDQIKADVQNERLAHEFANKNLKQFTPADYQYLETKGLTLGRVIHGEGGLDMVTFVPLPGRDAKPVLAFRGTKSAIDVVADIHPAGVGAYQMAANEGLIAKTLADLGKHGPVTVTGHSLGGALAQMTGTRFPDRIGEIVTFQSPGIPKEMTAHLTEHNAKAKATGAAELQSRHYEVLGDMVPTAGESFTPGTRTTIDRGRGGRGVLAPLGRFGDSAIGEHLSHPLQEFVDGGEGLGTHATPFGNGPPSAMVDGKPAMPRMRGAINRLDETTRKGVGRIAEMFERIGHGGHAPTETYVKVWNEVRRAIDQGEKPADIIRIIESSHARPDAKARMIQNLREIEATQQPADR